MGDLISRQAVLDELRKLRIAQQMMDDTQTADKIMTGLFLAEKAVKALSSIQTERKKGKWVDKCSCSSCHWIHEDDNGFSLLTNYKYCPNCGAKMEKE